MAAACFLDPRFEIVSTSKYNIVELCVKNVKPHKKQSKKETASKVVTVVQLRKTGQLKGGTLTIGAPPQTDAAKAARERAARERAERERATKEKKEEEKATQGTSPSDTSKNIDATERLDLRDTYLFTASATVLEVVVEGGDEVVILDRTIFHPQGGGQPSDTGFIKSAAGSFQVQMVKLVGNKVHHKGTFADGSFGSGDAVQLAIDESKRRLHARLHSAGHLVDSAIANLGFSSQLKPSKGYHFPDGPYVEYIGKLTNEQKAAFIDDMNEELKRLITERSSVEVKSITAEDLRNEPMPSSALDLIPSELCGGTLIRIVTVAEQPCPCEGTHVNNVGDVKEMKITKLKNKKGNLRVSYSVSQQ